MFMKPTDFCKRSQFLDMVAGRDAFAVSIGRIVGGRRDGKASGGIIGMSDIAIASSSTANCITSSAMCKLLSSWIGVARGSVAREDGLHSTGGDVLFVSDAGASARQCCWTSL